MHGICTLAANRTVLSLRISLLLFALFRCHATSGELASTVIANYLDYWQNPGNEIYNTPVHRFDVPGECGTYPRNDNVHRQSEYCLFVFFLPAYTCLFSLLFLKVLLVSLYFCRGKGAWELRLSPTHTRLITWITSLITWIASIPRLVSWWPRAIKICVT